MRKREDEWEAWSRLMVQRIRARERYYRQDEWARWAHTKVRSLRRDPTYKHIRDDSDKPTHKRLLKLVESQGYRCALSGAKLEVSTTNIDHIHPDSLGGTVAVSNLQCLRVEVNQMKHTLSQDDFIEWCRRVVEHSG